MTSHISSEHALNPNAPTYVGQSADNSVLCASHGLQTLQNMITNTASEMNISNHYFITDAEEEESDIPPTASVSSAPTLHDTDTKVMTSYLTDTDSDDDIPV